MKIQDLLIFNLPTGFRGASAFKVQFWWLVQSTLFGMSPQFMYGWRRFLLKLFGAKIGRGVLIRPSARVTYPWRVTLDDWVWIGDNTVLYSLGEIEIGAHAVVSQSSYLCAADHDYSQPDFPIRARKISIGSEVWVAADVFVAPGVTIGQGSVIGARSSVFKSMPAGMICYGYPCMPVKERTSVFQSSHETDAK